LSSSYWNIGIGREAARWSGMKKVSDDEVLGRNMAWLLKKLGS